MLYLISFLEGIITFISPCLLPMLPIYISYFAGGEMQRTGIKTLKNAVGFVLGFTAVFVAMGAFAGTIGGFLNQYQKALNTITGLIVVLFGLSYIGVFKLNIFRGINSSLAGKDRGFLATVMFGIVFSVGWTPCVGVFLGSALMMASQQGKALTGIMMLLVYSLGLGIPFVISALLIDKMKSAFNFIKRHYSTINIISGGMLIVLGILMMTGLMGKFLAALG